MKPMPIEITTDTTRLNRDRLHQWLSGEAYWSPGIPRALLDKAIDNSLCFGAIRDGELVGFARVITDRATFAWLCDVFVSADERGAGVGKRLMEAVMAHPDLQGLRRFLLATRDAHGLYRRYGFRPIDNPDTLMGIRRSAQELYADAD
jgi:GNAT superfamily N-acetyltransferase